MYLEHIIYSAAIAVIVGLVFSKYTGRDQAWVIIPISLIPDIDHINNIIWNYGLLPLQQKLVPFFSIGLFHNISGAITLFIPIFAILLLFRVRYTDAFIYTSIGLLAHMVEDYLVYPSVYPFLHPLSSAKYGINIIPENGDLIIAGSRVLIVGLLFLVSAIYLRYYLTNNGWLLKKEEIEGVEKCS